MRTITITYEINSDKFDNHSFEQICSEFDLWGNSSWIKILQISEKKDDTTLTISS